MLSARVRDQLRGTLDLRRRWWWLDRSVLHPLAVSACLLLPLVVATAIYLPFLQQWFLADDFIWLRAAANPNVAGFLKGALSPRGPTPFWRPLIDVYFFCMYRAFSLNGTAYHVVSLLVHGAVAAGTILFVWRVSRSLATGLLAGMLFAVTPAYGIAVTWVSSITELMSTLLSVATVLLYLKYLDKNNRIVLALAACTFVAATLAHQNAGAIPAVLIVLGLVVRAPKSKAELRRLALSLLPFIGLGGVYDIAQVSRLYVGSHRNYVAGNAPWHAAGSLLDEMRWLTLPLSSSHGFWLDAAQWGLLLVFTLVACLALVRRSWELPALFGCIVLALLPSSFLTFAFDQRWTYLAAVFWAGFVAMLIAACTRWLWSYNGLVSAAALVVVVGGFLWAFISQTRDAQRWMPPQATQVEQLSRAIRNGCPPLGPGKTAYMLALPIYDPGNTVPSLVRLLRPGSEVITVTAAASAQPAVGDCVIAWSAGRFQATEVGGGR
jgi:hypothetical protein